MSENIIVIHDLVDKTLAAKVRMNEAWDRYEKCRKQTEMLKAEMEKIEEEADELDQMLSRVMQQYCKQQAAANGAIVMRVRKQD